MDLGAIFLLLAVALMVALFVTQPLAGRRRRLSEGEHSLSALLAEHDRLLNSIQELDFDYSVGKVPAEDYPVQRRILVQRGVELLRRIDDLRQQPALSASPSGAAPGGSARGSAPEALDEELEELIARRRTERKVKVAGFCPRCGKPVLKTDAFCPSCGTALQ